jgi:hypothetical protein
MSIAKRPTEVRLKEDMVEDFKKQVAIAAAESMEHRVNG